MSEGAKPVKLPFSGGCACGAIRYESAAEPIAAVNCHCRDCQRETGSAYTAVLMVPKSGFKVTRGIPGQWTIKADSGFPTVRNFCTDCGSPLFGLPGSAPEMVTIRAGSLDDPSIFRPSSDIYTSRAQSWDRMNPVLPKFDKLPSR